MSEEDLRRAKDIVKRIADFEWPEPREFIFDKGEKRMDDTSYRTLVDALKSEAAGCQSIDNIQSLPSTTIGESSSAAISEERFRRLLLRGEVFTRLSIVNDKFKEEIVDNPYISKENEFKEEDGKENEFKEEDGIAVFSASHPCTDEQAVEEIPGGELHSYSLEKETVNFTSEQMRCIEQRATQRFLEGRIKQCAEANPDMPIEMIRELFIFNWKDYSDVTPFIHDSVDDSETEEYEEKV